MPIEKALPTVPMAKAKQEARLRSDWICEAAPKLQRSWIEFYLAVKEFKTRPINNIPQWKLSGWDDWEEFQRHVCKLAGEERAAFYHKLRAVERLKPDTIRRLGKSKSFMAAQLARQGKLTPEVEEKLEKASVEQAKEITRRESHRLPEEGRTKLTFSLRTSQSEAFMKLIERIRTALGLKNDEEVFDVLIGHLAAMSNVELRHTLQAEESKV